MKIKSEVIIQIVYDRISGGARFKTRGLKPGDEKLLYQMLTQFSKIAGSEKFRNRLIKQSFSKSWYKSNNPDVAPIARRSRGRGVVV